MVNPDCEASLTSACTGKAAAAVEIEMSAMAPSFPTTCHLLKITDTTSLNSDTGGRRSAVQIRRLGGARQVQTIQCSV